MLVTARSFHFRKRNVEMAATALVAAALAGGGEESGEEVEDEEEDSEGGSSWHGQIKCQPCSFYSWTSIHNCNFSLRRC